MRAVCERCGAARPDGDARICSFECTFCARARRDGRVCPNCGGELVARPRRVADRDRRAHLYVHLPFCAHAAATATSSPSSAARRARRYVDALLAELELERGVARADGSRRSSSAAARRRSPSRARSQRLLAALPRRGRGHGRGEPGDRDARAGRAAARRRRQPRLARRTDASSRACCDVLERVAGPDDVRRAVHALRDAGFDNISLDLIYGIPGQSPPTSNATSPRPSRSSPSTSPATSSRRSRARASRTPTGTSSNARPRRWRPTSSTSSRR